MIPISFCLTTFGSSPAGFLAAPIADLAQLVHSEFPIKTLTLGQIVEGHQTMEDSTGLAKIMVLVDKTAVCHSKSSIMRSQITILECSAFDGNVSREDPTCRTRTVSLCRSRGI